jgi:hypothetical protein
VERYLKEMLKVDDSGDYDLYTKRYEEKYLQSFSREAFSNDIKHMHDRNGKNTDIGDTHTFQEQ